MYCTFDHVLISFAAGPMIEMIQSQFALVTAEAVHMTPEHAERFHAVYKGVVAPPLHSSMVQELSSGAGS